jgi:hypothetical protein
LQKESPFRLRNPEDFGTKTEINPGETLNSPQTTTNAEESFYPEESGTTSAIDLSVLWNVALF